MKCPVCGFPESKVVDSRPIEDGSNIRRRRECLACQKRFTTFETIENVAFVVVKKNGNREMFDRTKLVNGMIRACEKRPVSVKQIENAVNEIEANLQSSMRSEVPSTEIGELVMENFSYANITKAGANKVSPVMHELRINSEVTGIPSEHYLDLDNVYFYKSVVPVDKDVLNYIDSIKNEVDM